MPKGNVPRNPKNSREVARQRYVDLTVEGNFLTNKDPYQSVAAYREADRYQKMMDTAERYQRKAMEKVDSPKVLKAYSVEGGAQQWVRGGGIKEEGTYGYTDRYSTLYNNLKATDDKKARAMLNKAMDSEQTLQMKKNTIRRSKKKGK